MAVVYKVALVSTNPTGWFTHDGGIEVTAANGPVSLQVNTDQLEILLETDPEADDQIAAADAVGFTPYWQADDAAKFFVSDTTEAISKFLPTVRLKHTSQNTDPNFLVRIAKHAHCSN